jgi:hypothetical protein
MTRHDRTKPAPSITALDRTTQPSAWPRDLLYGGGLGVAALVAALGFSALRPTPRRRPPTAPAPAWARHRRNR